MLRPVAGVANNTLDTYESDNLLMSNLPWACASTIYVAPVAAPSAAVPSRRLQFLVRRDPT
jgi:hypothetical protein